MKHFKKLKTFVLAVMTAVSSVILPVTAVYAADDSEAYGFTMSPLKENIILTPGETFEGSFLIHNPATHVKDFEYEITVQPFYVNEDYTAVYEEEGSYNLMVDWITIDSDTAGSLAPNQQEEIHYTINVPSNAPAGGQYAAITVTSANATNEGDGSAILEKTAIAHTIFAEVTGNTIHSGDITDANVPSFMLSGNIYGESTIKNTGNVHGVATYTLSVTPLFSSEEVYTNEENPTVHNVLPNRSYYNKIEWDETPAMGIFNVKYTVDFDGVVTEVNKMVIICPIWMMIVAIVVIVAIVCGIVMIIRKRK